MVLLIHVNSTNMCVWVCPCLGKRFIGCLTRVALRRHHCHWCRPKSSLSAKWKHQLPWPASSIFNWIYICATLLAALKPNGRHQQPFAVPEAPSGTQVEATFADSCNICVSMSDPGKLQMRYKHHICSLWTKTKQDGGTIRLRLPQRVFPEDPK